jgi:hypothetical protein
VEEVCEGTGEVAFAGFFVFSVLPGSLSFYFNDALRAKHLIGMRRRLMLLRISQKIRIFAPTLTLIER